MLFKTKKKIHVFSDGSLISSNEIYLLKDQIRFLENHFQNIRVLKKNLGKIEKREGLKFVYRKKFF